MREILRKISLFTAVIIMLSLFGCSKPDNLDIDTYKGSKPGVMLADLYSRTVGTPMEMPYFEIVMYTLSDTHVKIAKYTDGGADDEKVTTYHVPIEAAQKVFDVIRETGMDKWNDREDNVGLNGKLYVCKFPADNGEYIRVSSESMPENGTEAFNKVSSAMLEYATDEYIVE